MTTTKKKRNEEGSCFIIDTVELIDFMSEMIKKQAEIIKKQQIEIEQLRTILQGI